MKPFAASSVFLVLAFGLMISLSAPTVFAGGKSADKHARAREAKAEADARAEKKAEEKAAAEKAGVKVDGADEKDGWVWKHRRVRHKQTMPAAPTLSDDAKK